MDSAVRLFEVCLRDGLQNEPAILPTAAKVDLALRLAAAGFRDIEVTSFVRPRWVPQLADAADVFGALPELDEVRWWALVPNMRGFDRAVDAGVRHIATFLSVSETHNKKNVNRTVAESLAEQRRVIASARIHGMTVRAYVSTAFGCPYEGEVAPEQVEVLAKALLEAGADAVVLGDTIGCAHPRQVQELIRRLADLPLDRLGLHFHDTRGTALANVYTAWLEGITQFDGSLSGVGGCPYAPGASGNACTQDLVHLFDRMGVPTGVQLEEACVVGQALEDLLGRPLPGRYHRYWLGRQVPQQARSSA